MQQLHHHKLFIAGAQMFYESQLINSYCVKNTPISARVAAVNMVNFYLKTFYLY